MPAETSTTLEIRLLQPEAFEPVVTTGFWQSAGARDILPFVTSVLLHASILLVGVAFFYGVKYVTAVTPRIDQLIIPDGPLIDRGPPGGLAVTDVSVKSISQLAVGENDLSNGSSNTWSGTTHSKERFAPAGTDDAGGSPDITIGLASGGAIGRVRGIGGPGGGASGGDGSMILFGRPQSTGIGTGNPVFGKGSNASRIAFLCDASGSMLNKFATLRHELGNTLGALPPNRSFSVIFFQEQGYQAFDASGLIMATPENKLKVINFIEDRVTPRGETNPLPGLDLAFKQKPEVIYLLTDGDFPDNAAVRKRILELNRDHTVKVNTIAFVTETDRDTAFKKLLEDVARENGGTYRLVQENDLR